MVRPSRRDTLKVSFVNFTPVTRSSAVSAKMPMPGLQECRLMLNHSFLKPPLLLGREAEVPREADRLQPELGRQIVPIHMDVRRLIGFMAVGVERYGPLRKTVGMSHPFLVLRGLYAQWPSILVR